MYKDMIALANDEIKESKKVFTDNEAQFVVFYAYKMGDMKQVKLLIKELEHADEPGEMEDIFVRYSKQMNLKGGIEHMAEQLLVRIERYRLEQENVIECLSETLRLNGIEISEDEIRSTDMMEMKDKIAKVAAR